MSVNGREWKKTVKSERGVLAHRRRIGGAGGRGFGVNCGRAISTRRHEYLQSFTYDIVGNGANDDSWSKKKKFSGRSPAEAAAVTRQGAYRKNCDRGEGRPGRETQEKESGAVVFGPEREVGPQTDRVALIATMVACLISVEPPHRSLEHFLCYYPLHSQTHTNTKIFISMAPELRRSARRAGTKKTAKAAVTIADPDIDASSAKPGSVGEIAPRSRSGPRSHSLDPAAKPTEQAASPRWRWTPLHLRLLPQELANPNPSTRRVAKGLLPIDRAVAPAPRHLAHTVPLLAVAMSRPRQPAPDRAVAVSPSHVVTTAPFLAVVTSRRPGPAPDPAVVVAPAPSHPVTIAPLPTVAMSHPPQPAPDPAVAPSHVVTTAPFLAVVTSRRPGSAPDPAVAAAPPDDALLLAVAEKIREDEYHRDMFDLSGRARHTRTGYEDHVNQQEEAEQRQEELDDMDKLDAQYIWDPDGVLPPSSAPSSRPSSAAGPSLTHPPSPAQSLGEGGSRPRQLRPRRDDPSPPAPELPTEVGNMVLDSENSESDDDYEKTESAKQREKERLAARYAKVKSPDADVDEDVVMEDYRGNGAYVEIGSDEDVLGKGKEKEKVKEKPTEPPAKSAKGKGKGKQKEPPTKSSTAIAKGKGKQKEPPTKPPLQPSTTIVKPVAHKEKSKRKQKQRESKANAVDDSDSDDGGHTESDEDELDMAGFSSKIPGALSKKQKEELDALQERQEAEIAALAELFGKNQNVLERYLGRRFDKLKEKSGVELVAGVPRDARSGGWRPHKARRHREFNHESRAAYKKAAKLSDADLKNPELVKAALPWLFKWHEETMAGVLNNWRDTGKFRRIVQKAVKPIVDQAEVVGRQMGVDIMGYVIDASGTASFAFGSGPRYERVKTQYKSVLQRSLKDQEHIFGTAQIELDAIALGDDMPPVVLKTAGKSKDSHDSDRRLFRRVGARVLSNLKMSAETALKWKMKWGTQWADFAFENELRAINWYQALEDEGHILGVKVVVGKIRAKTLHDVILPGMVENIRAERTTTKTTITTTRTMQRLYWKWSRGRQYRLEEKAMPLGLQRNIPLVVSADGRPLVQVKHSTKYKRVNGAAEAKAEKEREKEEVKKYAARKKSSGRSHSPAPRSRDRARSPSRRESRSGPERAAKSRTLRTIPGALPSPSRVAFALPSPSRVSFALPSPSRRRNQRQANDPADAHLRVAGSRQLPGDRARARGRRRVAARVLTAGPDRHANANGIEANRDGQQKNRERREPSPPPRKPSPPPRKPSPSRKRKRAVSSEDGDRGEGPSTLYELQLLPPKVSSSTVGQILATDYPLLMAIRIETRQRAPTGPERGLFLCGDNGQRTRLNQSPKGQVPKTAKVPVWLGPDDERKYRNEIELLGDASGCWAVFGWRVAALRMFLNGRRSLPAASGLERENGEKAERRPHYNCIQE
ncbi:hypothetical protein C8J57DRAFT_1224005 [Mycena rebaudengoi]|nr:hypothetical protein C8J57DRAFT_1224005 [Mycena rebaudengoi]